VKACSKFSAEQRQGVHIWLNSIELFTFTGMESDYWTVVFFGRDSVAWWLHYEEAWRVEKAEEDAAEGPWKSLLKVKKRWTWRHAEERKTELSRKFQLNWKLAKISFSCQNNASSYRLIWTVYSGIYLKSHIVIWEQHSQLNNIKYFAVLLLKEFL
jgi:hypothetical protein